MKRYSFFFLLLFLAACSGAPDQETVQQVREKQPKRAQPLEDASTDYPAHLKKIGLKMPGKTAVIEAGTRSGDDPSLQLLSVKLLSSLSVKKAYQYYKEKFSELESYEITTDELFEFEDNPLSNRFIIHANQDSTGFIMASGGTANGAPEKTQITIGCAIPSK